MGITSTAARTACRELADRLDTRAATLRLPAPAAAATAMLNALVSIVKTRGALLRAS
jgi:hypothetical protein